MNAVTETATMQQNSTLLLSPLSLNNPTNPFRSSTLNVFGNRQFQPAYGLTPLSKDDLRRVYEPQAASVFDAYWYGDWPRDVLIHVLTRDVRVGVCVGLTGQELINQGQVTLRNDKTPGACRFKEDPRGTDEQEALQTDNLARAVVGATFLRPTNAATLTTNEAQTEPFAPVRFSQAGGAASAALLPASERRCNVVATADTPAQRAELLKLSSTDRRFIYAEPPSSKRRTATLSTCSGTQGRAIVLGGKVYLIEPRSIEDIVYYLGSLLRPGAKIPRVNNPGWYGGGRGDVPLFQVHPAGSTRAQPADRYAASLVYQGQRYIAAPTSDHVCSPANVCQASPGAADRTGTVLTLLSQLYSLTTSAEALQGPTRFILN